MLKRGSRFIFVWRTLATSVAKPEILFFNKKEDEHAPLAVRGISGWGICSI